MEIINKRLSRACEEAEGIENYDYLVINDDFRHLCRRSTPDDKKRASYELQENEKAVTQMREELKGF